MQIELSQSWVGPETTSDKLPCGANLAIRGPVPEQQGQ